MQAACSPTEERGGEREKERERRRERGGEGEREREREREEAPNKQINTAVS